MRQVILYAIMYDTWENMTPLAGFVWKCSFVCLLF
jgi:hypothetical protein